MKKLLFTVLFLLSVAGIAQAAYSEYEFASAKCSIVTTYKLDAEMGALLESGTPVEFSLMVISHFDLLPKGKGYAANDNGYKVKYVPATRKLNCKHKGTRVFFHTLIGGKFCDELSSTAAASGILEAELEHFDNLYLADSAIHKNPSNIGKVNLEPKGRNYVAQGTLEGFKYSLKYSPKTGLLKFTAKGGPMFNIYWQD